MRIVRSTVAHGMLVSVDKRDALAAEGVIGVWTRDDVQDIPAIPLREGFDATLEPYLQPVLARDRVRYVGEPVAAVFATDPYLAEDAAERVRVDIDERPVTLDAAADPFEFSPGHASEPTRLRKGYGDVDAAFAQAHTVLALDLVVGRHSAVPIETRGAIATYDAARDVLELYGAAKVPHRNRDALARLLGRPSASVHVYEGHVGGGFGVRGELYPEDILVCLAALRLRRPVKWIEDRYEHLVAANHSREQRHRVRAAVDREGRLLAIDDVFFHDQGAYVRTHGARVADLAAGMLPGPYVVPAYRATGHFRLTHKTPAATYRSPGRYESTFVRERVMDAVAATLGFDPVEVRRRNLIPQSAMPYPRPLDALGDSVELDSGDYAHLLDRALDFADWTALRQGLAERRARGECVGAGLAMFVEKSGLGPADGVEIVVDVTGAVEVITGAASLGQGIETVIAQICADALGVDHTRIRVTHGRTDRIAYGLGAHATRATVMTGSATHIAALALREKALEMASALTDLPAARLTIAEGNVIRSDGLAMPPLPLGEIARALAPTSKLRGSRAPGLSAEGWYETAHMNYPYGVHIAVVRVDRDTGGVAVERYVVAYDVGRAINPKLIEGQIAGGVVQGLGGALLESFEYDARGQPLAVTLADYLIPTACEAPAIEVLITEDAPSPLNPLGIKGAGEGGVNAVGAAIAAAIDDALGRPGAVTQLPVTPQRVCRLE